MARRSQWEELLAVQLTALQIEFKREQTLIPGRRFRFDFLVGQSLIAEVEGGTWRGGRHTTGAGFQKDCENTIWRLNWGIACCGSRRTWFDQVTAAQRDRANCASDVLKKLCEAIYGLSSMWG